MIISLTGLLAVTFSPVILDTDGALRWVSPLPTLSALFAASTFFDNAVYVTQGSQLFRIELDGTVTRGCRL